MRRLQLTGLIAATFTPMRADGSLDLDRVGPVVDHLVRQRVKGLYVVGTTGEGVSLSGRERMAVAEAFVAAAARRLPVIIQVGHTSLGEARELAAHAQRIGADAISAISPWYFRPESMEILMQCMAEITAGAPELPFYYYHIPSFTGVQMDMVEFLRLAEKRLANFAGLKYTCPTIYEYQACLKLAEDRLDVLFGCDEMLLSALVVGARGAVGTTYNFAAPIYLHLIEAFERRDIAAASRYQAQSVAMVEVARRYRGRPGLKAMMKLIGVDCGPSRLPQVTVSDTELEAMRQELEAIGFFEWIRS